MRLLIVQGSQAFISGIGGCNYTITLSVNNSAMGTVSGGGTYTQGATATISASANSGYHFDHWSDGNTQNPRTITINRNITLTAYFVAYPQYHTVTLVSNDYSRGIVTGGGQYEHGSTATCAAVPYIGCHINSLLLEAGSPSRGFRLVRVL